MSTPHFFIETPCRACEMLFYFTFINVVAPFKLGISGDQLFAAQFRRGKLALNYLDQPFLSFARTSETVQAVL